jgi:hypothetical protein
MADEQLPRILSVDLTTVRPDGEQIETFVAGTFVLSDDVDMESVGEIVDRLLAEELNLDDPDGSGVTYRLYEAPVERYLITNQFFFFDPNIAVEAGHWILEVIHTIGPFAKDLGGVASAALAGWKVVEEIRERASKGKPRRGGSDLEATDRATGYVGRTWPGATFLETESDLLGTWTFTFELPPRRIEVIVVFLGEARYEVRWARVLDRA